MARKKKNGMVRRGLFTRTKELDDGEEVVLVVELFNSDGSFHKEIEMGDPRVGLVQRWNETFCGHKSPQIARLGAVRPKWPWNHDVTRVRRPADK